MRVRDSIIVATAALALGPVSLSSAAILSGWDMETITGLSKAANALKVDPNEDSGSFNPNSGTSQQSNVKSRFGTYSAYIAGSSANMTIYNYGAYAPTGALTIMGHVNLGTAVQADERVIAQNMMDNGSDTLDRAGQYRLAVNTSSGKIYVDLYDNGNVDHLESAGGLIGIDTWTHVGMTFNGGLVKLYVDGNVVASQDYSGTLTTISNSAGDFPLVGNANWGARSLTGYLDDFYYNDGAALSDSLVNFYSTHTLTAPVPEPAIMGMLAVGSLMMLRRRKA
ncbi:MAG: PEP-CTERM sorting domain-containing protein [Phycisphaerales bacterium]|nr:PEP-CTERM sorting domain-containing protein [Phycisphaerales bacterium]